MILLRTAVILRWRELGGRRDTEESSRIWGNPMPGPHTDCKSCVHVWEVTKSWALGLCVPPYILHIWSGVLERYQRSSVFLYQSPVQKPLCCHHTVWTPFVCSTYCQLLASEDMPYSAVVLDGLIQKRNLLNNWSIPNAIEIPNVHVIHLLPDTSVWS